MLNAMELRVMESHRQGRMGIREHSLWVTSFIGCIGDGCVSQAAACTCGASSGERASSVSGAEEQTIGPVRRCCRSISLSATRLGKRHEADRHAILLELYAPVNIVAIIGETGNWRNSNTVESVIIIR